MLPSFRLYSPTNALSRDHSFSLLGLHPLCAVLLTAGYALREYASFNFLYSTRNLIIYILSQVLIYICP
jgi:hypothetical protein